MIVWKFLKLSFFEKGSFSTSILVLNRWSLTLILNSLIKTKVLPQLTPILLFVNNIIYLYIHTKLFKQQHNKKKGFKFTPDSYVKGYYMTTGSPFYIFLVNAPILQPLKVPENLWFLFFPEGIKREHWPKICWVYLYRHRSTTSPKMFSSTK